MCSIHRQRVHLQFTTCSLAWQVNVVAGVPKLRYYEHAHSKSDMTNEFISLKEVEELTGKSRSTLRRWVSKITSTANHPDRNLIQPSVDEVKKLHTENHPFSWTVSKTLVDRGFLKSSSQPKGESGVRSDFTDLPLLSMLQETIGMLKTELEERNKQVNRYEERHRESNLMLLKTTEKLALLEEGQRARPVHETATTNASPSVGYKNSEEGTNLQRDDYQASKFPTFARAWERLFEPVSRRK